MQCAEALCGYMIKILRFEMCMFLKYATLIQNVIDCAGTKLDNFLFSRSFMLDHPWKKREKQELLRSVQSESAVK